MSDQSIAAIARSLAAALLVVGRQCLADEEPRQINENLRVVDLELELCAEYRAEIIEALTVIA
jgi:hypothetical protein